MSTRIKWLVIGLLLASVSAWAAATHINRFIFRETPEITGSNAETMSNATNGVWAFAGRLDVTSGTPEITGSNDETISNATNGTWDFGSANVLTTGNATFAKGTASDSVKTTSAFFVDGAPILKTLTFFADSLGMTDVTYPAVITLESDITVLRAQVSAATAVAGNDCLVIFHSGTTADTVTVASAAKTGATTTDYNFSAAAICSLTVSDGSAGTGGEKPIIVIQYTEKRD